MPEGATVVVIAKSIASDADKATITEVPNEAAKVPPPVVVTAAVCSVTEEGIRVVEQLKDFMHEIKGLNDVEKFIKL